MATKPKRSEIAKQREQNEAESIIWQQRWNTAETEQSKLFEKFKDFFNVMYAVKSYKNVAPWRSKIYIPLLAGKAWDLIAKFSDISPRFVASIRDEWELDENNQPYYPEDVSIRAEKISQKLSYDYDNPFQKETPRSKVFDALIDAVVTGSGFAEVSRNVEEKKYRAHEAAGTDGSVNLEEEIIQTVTEGSNSFEPSSVFTWKFAPKTPNVQAAPWIIHDDFETLDELKRNPLYDQTALAGIDPEYQSDSNPMAQYEYARNQLVQNQDAVQADTSVKFLKTHKTFHRNAEGKVVCQKWVENGSTSPNEGGWVKIYEVVDPFWHDKYPVVGFYIRRKPYSVWGESLFENNETLQYAVNDFINHYMDNENLAIDGMVMMDENAYVEDFVVAPGELLIYKNQEPKQFKFPEPNPAQLSLIMNTMQEAIEAATVSSYASGQPSSELDQTQGTATGITKIMEAAQDKLGFMRTNFKDSMKTVGQMWLINDQQFMDRQTTIPVNTPDGVVPQVITPLDIQGVIDITIDDDSMIPVSKSGQREMKKDYLAQLLALQKSSIEQASLMQSPTDAIRLNFPNLIRDMSDAYSITTYSQYILPTPEPQPQEEEEEKPNVSINYKDAPEDVKRQMEESAGYEPSQGISSQGIKESQAQQKQEFEQQLAMDEQELKAAQIMNAARQANKPQPAPQGGNDGRRQ